MVSPAMGQAMIAQGISYGQSVLMMAEVPVVGV